MKALYDDKNKNTNTNGLARIYITLLALSGVAVIVGVLLFVYGQHSAAKICLFILSPPLFVPGLIFCFYDTAKRLFKSQRAAIGCMYLIFLYGLFAALIMIMIVYIIIMFAAVILLGLGGLL